MPNFLYQERCRNLKTVLKRAQLTLEKLHLQQIWNCLFFCICMCYYREISVKCAQRLLNYVINKKNNLSFDVNVKMRQVVWNCLPVQYKLHPRCSLTALSALDFSGELRSVNKAAIMGVVLHYSIFFMLYMHSLRICFGCLDGKFFSFRLVVSIIFGSLFQKLSVKIVRNAFTSSKKIDKKL